MFDAVCLASGGLDSSLCLLLLREQGINALPVYVNYGQRGHAREWDALLTSCGANQFHAPVRFDFPSFGAVIRTGLTDDRLRIHEDAFTPTRNLLFLVLAASVAASKGVANIVIGLLAERTAIFPDQSDRFLKAAENAISEGLGISMRVHCPLRDMTKKDVVALAAKKGVSGYSCHAGTDPPCGKCIACLEYA
jgi:7-cyano-7-deazaguanine synthase